MISGKLEKYGRNSTDDDKALVYEPILKEGEQDNKMRWFERKKKQRIATRDERSRDQEMRMNRE